MSISIRRFFLALLLLFASCSHQEVVEKIPEMYWPLPPEKPRIKFVDLIMGSIDAKMKLQKVKDALLGGESDVKFVKPFGVAAYGKKMFVTDIGGIYSYDFEKGKFRIIGMSDLRNPTGIAVHENRLYVCESLKKRVYVLDEDGNAVMEFGWKVMSVPAGLAIDKERDRVIVSDAKQHAVFVYSLNGVLQFSFGKRGIGPGEFNMPYGVAVDREGRIYVVDAMNFRVQIFNEKGEFLKSIGRIGTLPGNFARPKGIAIDSAGHIYVLDAAFGNFQIFDFEGNTLLAVGNSGKDPGEFNLPSSIYITDLDEIYIVDQWNRRVQIFQYLKD